jgi:hypothetical protein
MVRRASLLLGILSFALAWIVGVWCGHSAPARLQSAAIALACGLSAGAAIGVALQKIVLARLAETAQFPPPAVEPKPEPVVAEPAEVAA